MMQFYVLALQLLTAFGDPNYFVQTLIDVPYAVPIGTCFVSTGYLHMFTCLDTATGATVQEDVWDLRTDFSCARTVDLTTIHDNSDAVLNCHGTEDDDDYTAEFSLFGSDTTCSTIAAGSNSFIVNVCYSGGDNKYYKATCTDTSATITSYTDASCTSGAEVVEDIAGCFDLGDIGGGVDLYVSMASCPGFETSQTSTSVPVDLVDTTSASGASEDSSDTDPSETSVPVLTDTGDSAAQTTQETAQTGPDPTDSDAVAVETTDSADETDATASEDSADPETTASEDSADPETTISIPVIDLTEFASNYAFSDYIDSVSVPFPLDICVQTGLPETVASLGIADLPTSNTSYSIFACDSSGSTVSVTSYDNEDCIDSENSVTYVLNAEDTFVCSEVDEYATLDVCAGLNDQACVLPVGSLSAAIGVCFGLDDYYGAVTCDPDTNSIALYAFEDENCQQATEKIEIGSSDWQYLFEASGVYIFGKAAECVASTTDEATGGPNFASGVAMVGNFGECVVVMVVLSVFLLGLWSF